MKHKNLRNSLAAAVFIVASGISIAVMAACSKPKALPDGTFSGKADGRNGAIEIAFSVKDGKITSTEILKEEETDFAKPAIKSILEKFTSTGKAAGIDTVSGATITSKATLAALENAINSARGKKIRANRIQRHFLRHCYNRSWRSRTLCGNRSCKQRRKSNCP
ncbi:FMN-binding protein [uncultured Treponema sp.]|uniref:FMN-binding protein n=1 Tax=uncultured Treponema sp. TaxID=162155 RepID=UPI002583FC07|nr:FMN-binding protein [uncultured Treponema sp.]